MRLKCQKHRHHDGCEGPCLTALSLETGRISTIPGLIANYIQQRHCTSLTGSITSSHKLIGDMIQSVIRLRCKHEIEELMRGRAGS